MLYILLYLNKEIGLNNFSIQGDSYSSIMKISLTFLVPAFLTLSAYAEPNPLPGSSKTTVVFAWPMVDIETQAILLFEIQLSGTTQT